MRVQANEREARRNLMAIHLQKFKDEHLSKLTSDGVAVSELKEEMAAAQAQELDGRAGAVGEEEDMVEDEKEPVSEEEMQNRKMIELAEKHAEAIVKNKLFELSTQKQLSGLKQGKFAPIDFVTSIENDNERGGAEMAKEEGRCEDPNDYEETRIPEVMDDPEIQAQILKVEKLKMNLATDKQTKYVEEVKMSKGQVFYV